MEFEKIYTYEDGNHFAWRVTFESPISFNDFVKQLLANDKEYGEVLDSSNDFLLAFDHGVITEIDTTAVARCGNVQFQIIRCEGTAEERVYTIPLDI